MGAVARTLHDNAVLGCCYALTAPLAITRNEYE
jgi:hypothetical protein